MKELNDQIEKKLHFGADLSEKNRLQFFYSSIYDSETEKVLFHTESGFSEFTPNGLFQINDVPGYLDTTLRNDIPNLRKKEVDSYEGSLINLTGFNDLHDYLNNEISTRRRATLRRCENRLQLCIRPTYKMYFGQINTNEYKKIFDACYHMLLRRHQQKRTFWEELEYWKEREESLLELVLQKKACIFVIYHDQTPISIYVNSVNKHILDIDVMAYDIDYAKFKLGFISLIKVIQWAFENKLGIVDMSKGDFYYKERFRTGTYVFKKQLLYDSKNPILSVRAHLIVLKFRLLYAVLPIFKALGMHIVYRKYIRSKKESLFMPVQGPKPALRVVKSDKILSPEGMEKINIDNGEYPFLKEKFFDFLFLNFEFIKDVDVYHSKKNKKDYYFVGKTTTQKLEAFDD